MISYAAILRGHQKWFDISLVYYFKWNKLKTNWNIKFIILKIQYDNINFRQKWKKLYSAYICENETANLRKTYTMKTSAQVMETVQFSNWCAKTLIWLSYLYVRKWFNAQILFIIKGKIFNLILNGIYNIVQAHTFFTFSRHFFWKEHSFLLEVGYDNISL